MSRDGEAIPADRRLPPFKHIPRLADLLGDAYSEAAYAIAAPARGLVLEVLARAGINPEDLALQLRIPKGRIRMANKPPGVVVALTYSSAAWPNAPCSTRAKHTCLSLWWLVATVMLGIHMQQGAMMLRVAGAAPVPCSITRRASHRHPSPRSRPITGSGHRLNENPPRYAHALGVEAAFLGLGPELQELQGKL